jgi:hypothetical protein
LLGHRAGAYLFTSAFVIDAVYTGSTSPSSG